MQKLFLFILASFMILAACQPATQNIEQANVASTNTTTQSESSTPEFKEVESDNLLSKEILPPSNEKDVYTYYSEPASPSGLGTTLKKFEFSKFNFIRPTTQQLRTFFERIGMGNIKVDEDGLISGEAFIYIKPNQYAKVELSINRFIKYEDMDSNEIMFFFVNLSTVNEKGDMIKFYMMESPYDNKVRDFSFAIDAKGFVIKNGNNLYKKESF